MSSGGWRRPTVAAIYLGAVVAAFLIVDDFFVFAAIVLALSLAAGFVVANAWAMALPWPAAVAGVLYAALGPDPTENTPALLTGLFVVLAAASSFATELGRGLRRLASRRL